MQERLQKLMSQAGIASRRDSEMYIKAGRVLVNGRVAILGDRADLSVDEVRVDGELLRIKQDRVYIALYKPLGIITAESPQRQEKRKTVRDLIPIEGHLFPVGRLDADSEGLVLMTDDGDLAERLTHPRFEHPKTYEVTLRGNMPDEQLEKWRRGITLEDGPTAPADIKLISRNNDMTQIRIVMHEGRNRQIRRTASLLGNNVVKLLRTKIGPLSLITLRPGEWRFLSASEVAALQEAANAPRRRARRPYVPDARSAGRGRPANAAPARSPHRGKGPGSGGARRTARPPGATGGAGQGESSEKPYAYPSNPARPSRARPAMTEGESGDRPSRAPSSRPPSASRSPRPERRSGRPAQRSSGASGGKPASRAPKKRSKTSK